MRRFLICAIVCGVVWGAQHHFPDSIQPVVYVGLMLVVPLTLANALSGSGIPVHVIPLLLGFLASGSGLRHTGAFIATAPFAELAQAWVGLYLGACFSYHHRILSKHLGAATLLSVGATSVPAALALFLFLDIPAVQAIRLGLLAAMSGPMFTLISQSERREALSFSLLVTMLGLAFWFVADLNVRTPDLYRVIPSILMWVVGVDLIARITHTVRTRQGGHVLFGAIAATLFICAHVMQITPLFLALVTGAGVSARSGRSGHSLRAMAPLAVPLSHIVLVFFAASLDLSGLPGISAFHWKILVIYVAAMLFGKTIGGLAAVRYAGLFLRDWLQMLPQGVVVFILLPEVFPSRAEQAVGDGLTASVAIIGGIIIPLLAAPFLYVRDRMDRRRIPNTMELEEKKPSAGGTANHS